MTRLKELDGWPCAGAGCEETVSPRYAGGQIKPRTVRFHSNQCASRDAGVVAAKMMGNLAGKVRRAAGPASHRYPSRHPQYGVYLSMVQRCTSRSHNRFRYYGGRGITVCARWLAVDDGFWNYLEDLGPKPDDQQRWTVDRIDSDGHYEPGNVRWATYEQQMRNTRKYLRDHPDEVVE